MSDDKQKMIETLQRQIQEQRARMDPELLERAGEAAKEQMKKAMQPKAAAPAGSGETVPYDSKTAKKAVELFLKHHPDPASLEKLLAEILKKTKH